jgi:glycosyltransferase involved in cell wall biosynthesis
MNLIFWQNIVSPHQMPYINELVNQPDVSDVVLIVPETMSIEREQMGWKLNEINSKIKLFVNPSDNETEKIYKKYTLNSYHIYSGRIGAFPFVTKAFKISLKYPIKRGIISEQPFTYKKPLFLHFFKTLLYEYRYLKRIDYVYAIGEKAVRWYKFWNKKWKVIEFAYCVDKPLYNAKLNSETVKYLYVGSLIDRKNVKLVIKSLQSFKDNSFYFDIIGDGPNRKKLENYVKNTNLSNKISFKGSLSREYIQQIINEYDVLILPSKFDGWGAVVNEAIMAGLFVIVSDKCGSKVLIDSNKKRGIVFKSCNVNDLAKAMQYSIEHKEQLDNTKKYRLEWSECISAKAIAKYFIQAIQSDKYVTPPWESNIE